MNSTCERVGPTYLQDARHCCDSCSSSTRCFTKRWMLRSNLCESRRDVVLAVTETMICRYSQGTIYCSESYFNSVVFQLLLRIAISATNFFCFQQEATVDPAPPDMRMTDEQQVFTARMNSCIICRYAQINRDTATRLHLFPKIFSACVKYRGLSRVFASPPALPLVRSW